MLTTTPGWDLKVERGPDWLWVRLVHPDPLSSENWPFAEDVWALLERHFTYRLVLELDDIDLLDSSVIGQLALLDRRIRNHGGLLRLTGVSPFNQEVLHTHGLLGRFAVYSDLPDAVMGDWPRRPR
jgi:anti-anti-sigma regulatory factor